ncbi:MAG TPA: hypothetical protein VLJ62_05745 [Burkholderiaceae bacterium]|nr:hypothetical protein [Burkholderiaceae bacterium]
MTQVEIGSMDATIQFEPDTIAARPATLGAAAGQREPDDLMRLRDLLRPLVIELLEEELSRYTRMRG